jgi:hypothetical protein
MQRTLVKGEESMNKKSIFLFFLVFSFAYFLYAAEEVTMTTYYPVPSGNFVQTRVGQQNSGRDYFLTTLLDISSSLYFHSIYGASTVGNPVDIIISHDSSQTPDLVIDGNDGNVGIGTDAPTTRLEMVDTVSPIMTISNYNGNMSYYPSLSLRKARGNEDSPSNIIMNGILGQLNFAGYGSGFSTGACIYAKADTNWTSSDQDTDLYFQTKLNSTLADRMVITSDGKVGIGTVSPSSGAVLHVREDVDGFTGIYITNENTGTYSSSGIYFTDENSSTCFIRLYDSNFFTASMQNALRFENNRTDGSIQMAAAGTGGHIHIISDNGNLSLTGDGNLGFNTSDQFGGGTDVIGIHNASTVPTSNPANGGVLYAQSGALKWRGSSGTTTTIATAEPHCPVCGCDYMLEWDNEKYGYFAICVRCLADELGDRPWIIRKK